MWTLTKIENTTSGIFRHEVKDTGEVRITNTRTGVWWVEFNGRVVAQGKN